MGTMTVNEYYSKFIELMRFAPEMVPTEVLKAQRFEQGLTLSIQGKLGGANFNSLEEVYGRAAHLFGIKGRELEVNPGDKRKGSSNGFQGGDKRQKINGGFKQGKDDKSNGNNNNRSQSENGKSKRVYYCKRCPRNHPGRDCEGNLVTCRICSKLGHREYECFQKDSASANPKPTQNQGGNRNKGLQQKVVTHNRVPPKNGNGGDNQAKTNNQGRVFVMSNREAETTAGVVTGASHSFISKTLVEKLKLGKPELISMDIVIPSGDVINVSKLYRDVLVTIAGVEFPSDLIEFELDDLDIVMGMDWLEKFKAQIDCRAQKVTLKGPKGVKVTYRKISQKPSPRMISAMQLKNYIRKGYPLYLCSIQKLGVEGEKMENIPIVNEFMDVFPEEIPGMPPIREVEFTIDLMPGTGPISKAPYRMAPAEMNELKTQLEELLEKGYVRPSVSPWGAPVLFVKKKDGSLRLCIDYRYHQLRIADKDIAKTVLGHVMAIMSLQ
ncbi:uncharacterized protein LOC130589961 [Beta vulgaris subsp. vulgaris]|uniref:uncharacterized protein LOC130589961 n=1 Tax=Beta vulgaris subsp. vulgaris TaxID=3555 RepID=UPI002546A55B|nr:uncharacterized protein LOC130589961 [Beta vulgaris subsp. vulgaris]